MTRVLIPLVEGFEEIEAATIIDILRRADIEVTVASGTQNRIVTGGRDLKVEADTLFDEAADCEYDAIVLPGGPGTENLAEVSGLKELLKSTASQGKLVAAICAAPIILARAGLLDGKKVACYPSVEEEVSRHAGEIGNESVIEDGNLITSRGPATALNFALALAARLAGPNVARQITSDTLHASAD